MNNPALPQRLARDLGNTGLAGSWHSRAASLPADKGAYALVLRLGVPYQPPRPATATRLLLPGWYIYAGSACGPGGLRARLRRYFQRRQSSHWHIDQLTPQVDAMTALVIEQGDECDVVCRLSASYAFDVAIPRFGSSDCRLCPSHLLRWRPPDLWRP